MRDPPRPGEFEDVEMADEVGLAVDLGMLDRITACAPRWTMRSNACGASASRSAAASAKSTGWKVKRSPWRVVSSARRARFNAGS
jgi:hypothetical protein